MNYKLFAALSIFLFSGTSGSAVEHTYLYWSNPDTSHTMTIVHHSKLSKDTPTLYLSPLDTAKNKTQIELRIDALTNCYKELDRCIHEFKLLDLKPAAPYFFRIKSGEEWQTTQKKFKTLPDNTNELTFVDGGDLSTSDLAEKLVIKAGTYSPDFVLLGGDLVYDDGDISKIGLWDTWLDRWEKGMITKDGFTIPIISAIGNHEVKGGWNKSPKDSTLYLKFFRQEEDKTYFKRNLSDLAVLLVLDSGHVNTHESQVPWIKKTLQEMKSAPFKMVAYHVPLYPSARPPSDQWVSEGKKHWTSLFEDYGVDVAFEHHDHALKRTHHIKKNKIDKEGVLYLGDGCMGKDPRRVRNEWYLANAKSIGHFWLGKIHKDQMKLQAIGVNGEVLDEVIEKTKSR